MLWLLTRTENLDYDEAHGMVVRARTEEEARKEAAKESKDEGETPWLTAASCTKISGRGKTKVIMINMLNS